MTQPLQNRRALARRRPPRGSELRLCALRRSPLAAGYSPLPTSAPQLAPSVSAPPRRGISLLEVLISMFVLLFGLMGVAAIFPVGNHYAARSEQFDRGSALAQSAFADLKARGMLKPELWLYSKAPTTPAVNNDLRIIQPGTGPNPGEFNSTGADGVGLVFVIDPIGVAAGLDPANNLTDPDIFPFAYFSSDNASGEMATPQLSSNTTNAWPPALAPGSRWPIRRITLPTTDLTTPTMTPAVAEVLCTLRDDVTNEFPDETDRPGIQRWTAVDRNATPTPDNPADDTLLARQYAGSFSWMATVVPTSYESGQALQPTNSRFGSDLYEVSVAVFNKRETTPSPASERTINALFNLGGELVISAGTDNIDAVDAAADGIRPGQWIAVAGPRQNGTQFLFKWYRVLSIEDETQDQMNEDGSPGGNFAVRRLMLDGPEWPQDSRQNLRAILLPGVVSVSTQMLPMESAQ